MACHKKPTCGVYFSIMSQTLKSILVVIFCTNMRKGLKVSRSLLFALATIPLAVKSTTAQMDIPAIGSAGTSLKSGGSCVRLDTQIKVEGMKIRLEAGKPQTFYFRDAQVYKFPEPIKLSVSAFANCAGGPSFAWPDFAEDLHFSFTWDTSAETNRPHLAIVRPTHRGVLSPLWSEGSSSKNFWFTIPAEGVSIGSKLNIDVYSGGKLLRSYSVQMGKLLQS
jgi:hypothetical protein